MFLRFLRRKKASPPDDPAREVPPGVRVPEHLGDLWSILQDIAREEDPRFATRSVAEHLNSSGEGQRDVLRWLAIYQRRLGPDHRTESLHAFSFPPHHPRHRGHVLAARNWPEGLRWEAFDEATLQRAPIPQALDLESVRRALDHHLDGAASRTVGDPG